MAEYWQEVHTRGQQSLGVWETFDPTFTVGELTLATHQADVAAILTAANTRDVQQDVVDDAMAARDANRDFIRDVNARAPQLFAASLADGDPLKQDMRDITRIRSSGQQAVMERARVAISMWNRVNAARAEATPPLPPLTLGATAVADLQTALDGQPALLQNVANEKAELSQKKSALRAASNKVDRGNKRWYAAWSAHFPPGTPEHDALSQIEIEAGTLPPEPVQFQSLTQNGNLVDVVYAPGGGAHATSLTLVWQVVGVDPDFAHPTPVVLAGQSVGPFTGTPTIHFKVIAENSQGTAESAVWTITL